MPRLPRLLPRPLVFVLGLVLAAAGCAGDPAPDAAEPTPVRAAAVPTRASAPPPPPGLAVPDGMVFVPGGAVLVGADDGLPTEAPPFAAEVAPFFLDRAPVTVADFRAFVEATGHRTEAEGFGNSAVLDARGAWVLVDGADWRRPLGPDGPPAEDDHPVVHVSWNDAAAYAAWAGKRLPTEVEWEHAARGARNARDRYPWGPDLAPEGRHRANTWQGPFPQHNEGADGYAATSPVGAFGETALGLVDLGGNVWEWTDAWFRPYAERDRPFTPDAASERVQRGGSFLCTTGFCHGFRVSARSHSTPESSLFHVGFRCAKDVDT